MRLCPSSIAMGSGRKPWSSADGAAGGAAHGSKASVALVSEKEAAAELATLAKRVAQDVRVALLAKYRENHANPYLADYQLEVRVAWGERWLGWIANP